MLYCGSIIMNMSQNKFATSWGLGNNHFVWQKFGLELGQIWQGLTCKEQKEMEHYSLMATRGKVLEKLVIIRSWHPYCFSFCLLPGMLFWISTCTGSCAGGRNLTVFELGWKAACISLPSLREGRVSRWWERLRGEPWLTPRWCEQGITWGPFLFHLWRAYTNS
jgi:hypothetical protein